MNPPDLRHRAAVAAVFAAFGFVLFTLGASPAGEASGGYGESLGRIGAVDSALNVHVLRSAGPYFHNYDRLTAAALELDALATRAASPPPASSTGAEEALNDAVVELRRAVDEKRRLVERFKAHNAVLKNSRTWLLTSLRDGDGGAPTTPEAMRELTDLLLYHGESADTESLAAVDAPLARWEDRLRAEGARAESIAYVQNLRRHVEIFVNRLPRVRALVDEIVTRSLAPRAEVVAALYREQDAKRQRRSDRFQALAWTSWLLALLLFSRGVNLVLRDRKALRRQVTTREQQLEVELELRKQSEQVLQDLAGVLSSEGDASFFQTLVNRLARSLDLEMVAIAEPDETFLRTLAISRRGRSAPPVIYPRAHTPCEKVVGREFCCFPEGVAAKFPEDLMLAELGIESYCGVPLFDSKGQPTGLLLAMDTEPFRQPERIQSLVRIAGVRVADELERRHIEASIRADRERLAVMLRSIGDGVIATDLSGRVLLINREAERLTGWDHRDAVGRDLVDVLDFLSPGGESPTGRLMREVLETGRLSASSTPLELRRSGDGAVLLVRDSRAPILDDSGGIIGGIWVLRDVTDQVQVQTEKTKIEAQLLQLQKMETIGTLAGGIAHEFNNLLTPLVGFAALIQEVSDDPAAVHEYAERILSGSIRAQKLVSQILRFGHQHTLEYRPVRLTETVNDVVEMIRSVAPSTIEVAVQVPAESAPVLCDENQIHQVLMNLCINACHAMERAGGALRLSLGESSGGAEGLGLDPAATFVTIAVSDAGVGMTTAVRERIFDPFYTTRTVGQGTGLGLSVALGIVKSHGGTIAVESEPGAGSTFTIYLPRDSSPYAVAPIEVEAPDAATGHRERILFIDDEADIVDMARDLLTRCGYVVTAFRDSREALEAFSASPSAFDLVLTDYTMPGLNGFQLGQAVRDLRPDIPILLATGFAEAVTEELAFAQGFAGLMMKPIVVNDLRRAIRSALDGAPVPTV